MDDHVRGFFPAQASCLRHFRYAPDQRFNMWLEESSEWWIVVAVKSEVRVCAYETRGEFKLGGRKSVKQSGGAGNNEFCKLGRLFCDCRLRCRKWSNADFKGEMTVEAHLGVQKSSIVSGIEIILI